MEGETQRSLSGKPSDDTLTEQQIQL